MVPWAPLRLIMLDLRSSAAICLHANEMLESTTVSSASILPACSCFRSHIVKFSISNLLLFLSFFSWLLISMDPTAAALHLILAVTARDWLSPVAAEMVRKEIRIRWRRKKGGEEGVVLVRITSCSCSCINHSLDLTLSLCLSACYYYKTLLILLCCLRQLCDCDSLGWKFGVTCKATSSWQY